MDYNPTIKSPICFISSSTSYHNQSFLCNSGKFLLVPYTKDFWETTHFRGNDLATMPFAAFCLELLSSNSLPCKGKMFFRNKNYHD